MTKFCSVENGMTPQFTEEDGLPLPTDDDKYLLEFGCDNKLDLPVSMAVLVVNTSAIPTSLEMAVSHFIAADVPNHGMCVRESCG